MRLSVYTKVRNFRRDPPRRYASPGGANFKGPAISPKLFELGPGSCASGLIGTLAATGPLRCQVRGVYISGNLEI